jgi:hypothetical protein
MKSKKEIIQEISDKLEVSNDEASQIFKKAMASGDIKKVYHWKSIMDAFVVISLVFATAYALLKIILSSLR